MILWADCLGWIIGVSWDKGKEKNLFAEVSYNLSYLEHFFKHLIVVILQPKLGYKVNSKNVANEGIFYLQKCSESTYAHNALA